MVLFYLRIFYPGRGARRVCRDRPLRRMWRVTGFVRWLFFFFWGGGEVWWSKWIGGEGAGAGRGTAPLTPKHAAQNPTSTSPIGEQRETSCIQCMMANRGGVEWGTYPCLTSYWMLIVQVASPLYVSILTEFLFNCHFPKMCYVHIFVWNSGYHFVIFFSVGWTEDDLLLIDLVTLNRHMPFFKAFGTSFVLEHGLFISNFVAMVFTKYRLFFGGCASTPDQFGYRMSVTCAGS